MGETIATGGDVDNTLMPPLPAMFNRYRGGLEEELRASIPFPPVVWSKFGQPSALYGMLQYHMGWADEQGTPMAVAASHGKALRPTLCLFACDALSNNWARALPTATALEYIHNFSLIHDDIQDEDIERRHQPTVWALWGQAQALIAGNAMRSLADITALRLTERDVPEAKALRASSLLTEAYLAMTNGQCLDLAFEDNLNISLDDYLTMVSCKTAALIRCGMEMGATLASDDESTIRSFAFCGVYLGLAFQMRDDMLGIWGDESAMGKSVGNDIRRRKKTFPIVYALKVARTSARQRLVDAYTKADPEEQDVQDVLTVLEELKVADYTEKLTQEKARLAMREARQIEMPSWAHREIEELANFLTTREF